MVKKDCLVVDLSNRIKSSIPRLFQCHVSFSYFRSIISLLFHVKKPKYLKTSDPIASNKFVLNKKIEEFAAYAWVILLSEKKKKKFRKEDHKHIHFYCVAIKDRKRNNEGELTSVSIKHEKFTNLWSLFLRNIRYIPRGI